MIWFIAAIFLFLVLARTIEINLHVMEQFAALKGTRSVKSRYSLDVHLFMVTIMVMVISTNFAAAQKWQADVKKHEMIEKQHITSELALLKAQINPHFFFNTLNNIYALTYSDVPLSREAILKLSRMMRYVLYDTLSDQVLLSQEMSFMNDYIELMKLRLHACTALVISKPKPDRDYSVAPMLLLPFIENAFKHGTSSLQKTEILMTVNAQNNVLELNVFYPGRYRLKINEDLEKRTYQVDLKIQLG